MNIVFFGTPDFSVPTLEAIARSSHSVAAVVSAPDKPSGRSRRMSPPPVKKAALNLGLPVLQPERLDDTDFLEQITNLRAEIGVVVAFRILPAELIAAFPKGCVNLHPSLLPELRGAAPMRWALMKGCSQTGLTTFRLEKRVDTGDILLQRPVPIAEDEDYGRLSDHLARQGAELMLATLDGISSGSLSPRPQVGRVTRAPRIDREHCRIDWNQPAAAIRNQIRALSPEPAAFTLLSGKTIKVFRSALDSGLASAKPGEVTAASAEGIVVQTGNGGLRILELQLEGRRRLSAAEFLKGHKVALGTQLG